MIDEQILVAISENYAHHGRFSSYHHLIDYLPDRDVVIARDRKWMTLPARIEGKRANAVRRIDELRAHQAVRKTSARGLLYLYPEHGCRSARSIPRSAVVSLVCHLPGETMEEVHNTTCRGFSRALPRAEKLIVMSPDQAEYYRSLAPNAEILWIPHGVDSVFFHPLRQAIPRVQPLIEIVSVGNMLRDVDLLAKVILESRRGALSNTRFTVVSGQPLRDALADQGLTPAGDLRLVSGLSDCRLLQLYHSSDIAFVPVVNATANNAILEAMASGLPVVSTDLPAIRAYVESDSFLVPSRDSDAAIHALRTLSSDADLRAEVAASQRARVEDSLAWDVIAPRVRRFAMDT